VLIDQLSPILTSSLEALNNAMSYEQSNINTSEPHSDFHDRLLQMELIYQHILLTKADNPIELVDEKELLES
jgi:hypothetical protein